MHDADVTGEGGQQHPPRPHVGHQRGADSGDVAVEVVLCGVLAGQRPGAEREADPLPGPRVEQPGRVAGRDHPAAAQRRAVSAAAGQVTRVLHRPEAGQTQPGHVLPQVSTGRVALTARGDDTDGKPVPLGKEPAVRSGDLAPVELHPAGPLRRDAVGHLDFQLKSEVDLVELGTNVPGRDAGRAIGADDRAGSDLGSVREPRRGVTAGLTDPPDLGPLPDHGAVFGRPVEQRGVELLAEHHRQQRLGLGAGELVAAAQRDRHRADLVPGGHLDQPARSGPRRADEATAAGLVPRVLGPLEHDRARARGGRRTGRGQPGRPGPDDGDIPFRLFCHTTSLGDTPARISLPHDQPRARAGSRSPPREHGPGCCGPGPGLAGRSQPLPFGISGCGQRARTESRLSASVSSSVRLQKAKRTMVRPSSGWSL